MQLAQSLFNPETERRKKDRSMQYKRDKTWSQWVGKPLTCKPIERMAKG